VGKFGAFLDEICLFGGFWMIQFREPVMNAKQPMIMGGEIHD
jgi:hypothetical protein